MRHSLFYDWSHDLLAFGRGAAGKPDEGDHPHRVCWTFTGQLMDHDIEGGEDGEAEQQLQEGTQLQGTHRIPSNGGVFKVHPSIWGYSERRRIFFENMSNHIMGCLHNSRDSSNIPLPLPSLLSAPASFTCVVSNLTALTVFS